MGAQLFSMVAFSAYANTSSGGKDVIGSAGDFLIFSNVMLWLVSAGLIAAYLFRLHDQHDWLLKVVSSPAVCPMLSCCFAVAVTHKTFAGSGL